MEGRGGYLYHSTKFDAALSIIKSNTIEARTNQAIDTRRGRRIIKTRTTTGLPIYGFKLKGGRHLDGVSLTRDYTFALAWKPDVVLVLDQRRLDHDYKIIPVDHVNGTSAWDYGSPGSANMQRDWWEQYEEFVVGPIKNLSRYLVSVNICLNDLDRTNMFDQEERKVLYRHPLLNKVYPRIYSLYYDRMRNDAAYSYRSDFVTYHALKKQGMSDEEALDYIRRTKPEREPPEDRVQ